MTVLSAFAPYRKHWFSNRFKYEIFINFESYASGEGDYLTASRMFTGELLRIAKQYPDIELDYS